MLSIIAIFHKRLLQSRLEELQYALWHSRKHMHAILTTMWRTGFKAISHDSIGELQILERVRTQERLYTVPTNYQI